MVAATTHYAELKAYAHTTEGARNASVEFDLETLSPTYRLSIGLPGGSQAFAIAERLGLSPEIVTDARSRLSEAQRSFEATLAAIKATEGQAGEALDRARAAELRAADALRVADEERRRARRERDEATRAARNEADEILEQLRDTVRDTRRALERETVTASSLDSAVDRAGAIVEQLPDIEDDAAPVAVVVPRQWQLGERARSVSGGWEGRIAALERGGQRATLEAGGMRVTVDVDDLVLAQGPASNEGSGSSAGSGPTSNAGSLRLEHARTVASSLDLRGARVDEALDALARYLDDAAVAGMPKVTIIHGLGTGALRDAVRRHAADHPGVVSVRPGERGEGGDGATIVTF